MYLGWRSASMVYDVWLTILKNMNFKMKSWVVTWYMITLEMERKKERKTPQAMKKWKRVASGGI